MGHPRKIRRKFSKPFHPWQKERIDAERILVKDYGFKNKQEIWKMNSVLGKFKEQSKKLIAATNKQAQHEKTNLLKKAASLGIVNSSARIEDVLSISLNNILERRLQTIVYKKKLANSMKQARQFITHEHICVGNRTITSPSYLVKIHEEPLISFNQYSQLINAEHPARQTKVKAVEIINKAEDTKK